MENFYKKFKVLRLLATLLLFMVAVIQGFSQDRSVSGRVTARHIGANWKGNGNGTSAGDQHAVQTGGNIKAVFSNI